MPVIVSHVAVGCLACGVVWSDRAGVKLSHPQKGVDAPLAFWVKVDPRHQGQADEILNRPQDTVIDTVLCLFCIMFLVHEVTFFVCIVHTLFRTLIFVQLREICVSGWDKYIYK